MSFFIQACVADSHIFTVRSQTTPIEGLSVEAPMDFAINAEIEGDYLDAGAILPVLALNGQTLTGIKTVSQTVVAGQP